MSNGTNSLELDAIAWPLEDGGKAMELLARHARLGESTASATRPWQEPDLESAMRESGAAMSLEVERLEVQYEHAERVLLKKGPALLRVADRPELVVAWLGTRRGVATILHPDQSVRRIPCGQLRNILCGSAEAKHRDSVERMLAPLRLSAARAEKASARIFALRMRRGAVFQCWQLHVSPARPFAAQFRAQGLPKTAAMFFLYEGAVFPLTFLFWWTAAGWALQGRFDPGYFAAWILTLATCVALRVAASWREGVLAIGVGVLLKRKLLFGALKMDPNEIRREGIGQLLGRVLESQAFEILALRGGMASLLAVLQLLIAAAILWSGPGGLAHAAALLVWGALTAAVAVSYARARKDWAMSGSGARLGLTHDLVETMAGNRTRLVQLPAADRHTAEDAALTDYQRRAVRMDRRAVLLRDALPAAWLPLGLLLLLRSYSALELAPARTALALAGVLLGYWSLSACTSGIEALVDAWIAWSQTKPYFDASARADRARGPHAQAVPAAAGDTLLEAHELSFRYPGRRDPVLAHCGLRIAKGDRIFLEGSSGAGKSTLAHLLAGLREPSSGLLLFDGRRDAVLAPQFHENFVLMETFNFNLFMGRAWPPLPEDLTEGLAICEELGLGELLAKMPSGLQQMVGEAGWQLSHGERSRLYVARALLQRKQLIMLDESFAALDPATHARVLDCVLKRAPTLLVIAHP